MKKNFLIGLAATAMLTGCSNDETVEMASQKAIGFETFVDKATRANKDLTNTSLNEFAVYGIMTKDGNSTIKVLGNEKVSRPSTVTDISEDAVATAWTYSSTQYWNEGYTYWFSAIAPYGGNWTFENTADGYTYGFENPTSTSGSIARTLTFNNEAAQGKEDLIYAGADAVSGSDRSVSSNDPVMFTFKHLLSRVKFTFNNMVGDQYVLKVQDLKISAKASDNSTVAIYKNGTCNVSDWTLSDTEGFDLAFDNQLVYQNETGDAKVYNADVSGNAIEDHRYIIPKGDGNDITITCSFTLYANHVKVTDGSLDFPRATNGSTAAPKECTGVKLTITGGFKLGYSYNFTADITANEIADDLVPINFTVSAVDDWVYTDHAEEEVSVPDQSASNP